MNDSKRAKISQIEVMLCALQDQIDTIMLEENKDMVALKVIGQDTHKVSMMEDAVGYLQEAAAEIAGTRKTLQFARS